jgi:CRP/FNR family cyclic AMP-dependent transcriptional regulator
MTTATAADLRAIPQFATLGDRELGHIAPLFTIRAYPKNSIIISEGEPVGAVFFVLSGRVRLFWRDPNGEEMDLAILAAGENFGLVSLIEETILTSFIAIEPLVVAAIPSRDLESLLVRFPAAGVLLLKEAVRVIRLLIQRAKVFSMEDVYGRVVWILQRHATASDGRLITDRLTHADIARRVGATREMVGQVLRHLARDGYLATGEGRFEILKSLPRRR